MRFLKGEFFFLKFRNEVVLGASTQVIGDVVGDVSLSQVVAQLFSVNYTFFLDDAGVPDVELSLSAAFLAAICVPSSAILLKAG